MFETLINIFESFLIVATIYMLCKDKKANSVYCAVVFWFAQFSFISITNYISMTESIFGIIEVAISLFFLCLLSNDSFAYKFFICAIPYNVIGIENTIQNTTVSYILFHKIDYYLLAEKCRIINVLISQVVHAIIFYFIVKAVKRIDCIIKDRDYYLLGFIFFLCNFMTICFESLGYHFDNQGLFMLMGIYSIVLFIVSIIYLFISVYRHSVNETKQNIELDILKSQQESNNKILEAQNSLYQLRHDMKHLIQILKNPEVSNNRTIINDAINKYEVLIKDSVIPINTISPAINYIINIKREEAKNKNIDFVTKLNITNDIKMDSSDLYLLLANLLDNAIKHIGISKKISVEMKSSDNMFVIRISNSIDHHVLNKDGEISVITTNQEHGYGIRTIENILKKYDGVLSYTEENNELVASILLTNSD